MSRIQHISNSSKSEGDLPWVSLLVNRDINRYNGGKRDKGGYYGERGEIAERTQEKSERGGQLVDSEGMRQGCLLSMLLFTLLVANIEEEMRRWGEVNGKLGEDRIYTVAYADDIALLVENKKEIKSMIERLEWYLEKKELELNTEKTKIMRFRKGRRGLGKRD